MFPIKKCRKMLVIGCVALLLMIMRMIYRPQIRNVMTNSSRYDVQKKQNDYNPASATYYLSKTSNKKPLLILFWTPRLKFYIPVEKHPVLPDKCEFTSDRSRVNSADFVLIHFQHIKDKPPRQPWQRWVIHSKEPPSLQKTEPDDLAKLDGVFNFTSSYSYLSDIPLPFGYCMVSSRPKVMPAVPQKPKLVAWVASHCITASMREMYISHLQKHIHIDIYGSCGPGGQKMEHFDDVIQDYKFYIAFENSLCKEYVTEKLYKFLARPWMYVIPVVLGTATMQEMIPQGSYIDVRDFPDASALAEHLLYLDQNQTAFMQYSTWTRHHHCLWAYDPGPEPNLQGINLCEAAFSLANVQQQVSVDQLIKVYGKQHCLSAHSYYRNITSKQNNS